MTLFTRCVSRKRKIIGGNIRMTRLKRWLRRAGLTRKPISCGIFTSMRSALRKNICSNVGSCYSIQCNIERLEVKYEKTDVSQVF